MKYFILLLCATCACTTNIKEVRKIAGPRIVNGNEAKETQFPWQVGIYGTNNVERYFCGGTIIADQWILTAGHCVVGARTAQIYSGSTSISAKNHTVSTAAQFIVHEKFNANNLLNDIGLIKLDTKLEFNDFINNVTLSDNYLEGDTSVTLSGWGQTSDADSSSPDALQFIEVNTITNERCRLYYGTYIGEGVVCTEAGNPLKSPCLGDSGAPVVQFVQDSRSGQNKIVHVATFSFVNGYGCEFPYPAGYTRTSEYRDWIIQNCEQCIK